MITLTIPPPEESGRCNWGCTFLDGDGSGCELSICTPHPKEGVRPGPACMPGEYVLAPKAQWEKVQNWAMDSVIEDAKLARRALGEEVR